MKVLAFYDPQLKLRADIFKTFTTNIISAHGFIRGVGNNALFPKTVLTVFNPSSINYEIQ
ncbi:MAG: hypothetical protein K9J33_01970 [Bacteroidales bacterium]|nr:hypothetical protein [Bacteroidales bacterium]